MGIRIPPPPNATDLTDPAFRDWFFKLASLLSNTVDLTINNSQSIAQILAQPTPVFLDFGDSGEGMDGPPGLRGLTGASGPAGPAGPAVFLEGEQGEEGSGGPPGSPGPQGNPGVTGASGPTGPAIYLEAEPGEDGMPGVQGSRGPTGSQGPQGPAVYLEADQSEEGLEGPPGQTGAAGATGGQGPIGPAVFLEGDAGEDGVPGSPGRAGLAGVTGAAGPAGPAIFLEAEPGEDGSIGVPGTTVSVQDDNTSNISAYPIWSVLNSGALGPFVSSTRLTFNPQIGQLSTLGGYRLIGGGSAGSNGLFSLGTNTIHLYTASTTAVNIDAAQTVIVGAATVLTDYSVVGSNPKLQLPGIGENAGQIIRRYSADNLAARLIFSKSRGTILGVDNAAALNDGIGTIVGTAYSGSAYLTAAQIRFGVDATGTVSATSMPGNLTFYTVPDGTTSVVVRLNIDNKGNVNIGDLAAALSTSATDGFLYIPTCAGAPTGVPTTKTGTVAMVYDTTNNKLMLYNGAWKGALFI